MPSFPTKCHDYLPNGLGFCTPHRCGFSTMTYSFSYGAFRISSTPKTLWSFSLFLPFVLSPLWQTIREQRWVSFLPVCNFPNFLTLDGLLLFVTGFGLAPVYLPFLFVGFKRRWMSISSPLSVEPFERLSGPFSF